jgi:hypothetical protein
MGKLFILHGYLLLGDTIDIGEAGFRYLLSTKGIFSSHPMHPVPHLSLFFFDTGHGMILLKNIRGRKKNRGKKTKKKRVV